MVRVLSSTIISAPRSFVFDYVADLRHADEWVFGIEDLKVIGAPQKGIGAVYRGSVKLGPKVIHSQVEVTGWSEHEMLSTTSTTGFTNQSTWHFLEYGDSETEIVADVEYQLPGGLAGRAFGHIIEPFITIAVKHSERKIREIVERRYRQSTSAF